MATTCSSHPFLTLLIAITLPLLILILYNTRTSKRRNRRMKLPPGPPSWPIVGNLLQVARSDKPFIHYIRDIRDAYGPIFTLQMGARTLIVVTSPELAHEALVERGPLFASRPAETPTRAIFSSHKFTVNSAPHGSVWRSLRRNLVSNALSAPRLREFRPVRHSAMDRLIHRIRLEAECNFGNVWVLRHARFAVFRILLAMCFGVELNESTVESIEQVMKRVLVTLNPRMDDYLPLLAPLFAKQRKAALEVRKLQLDTLVPLIKRRRTILAEAGNATTTSTVPFSYLDSLLDLRVESRESALLTDTELVTLCSEFLNGGTDTTATAIEWGIARLIENSAMQDRIFTEILSVCGEGSSRTVEEEDTERMPYLQAFVKELLRKHPPTYFLLSHATEEEAELGGYDIPAGANVEFYLPTIAEDPKLWQDPAVFEPERFLTGREGVDMTGVTAVRMIPFGAGRRICPGMGIGTTHITLMIARMVQAFEWRAHPDQAKPDFDGGKLEFTVVMPTPLQAVVKERK